MNKISYLLLSSFFASSLFIFGWLSHSAYTPGKKIKKISYLEKIKRKKVLSVVLLNGPTTYYIGVDGEQGFEYDLLKEYAKHLGVKLKIKTAHTIAEALELSKDSDIDITSASLTKTPLREKKYYFGPSYFEIQEQVVCHRDMLNKNIFPRDIEDLAGLNILVGDQTSYKETIISLKNDGFDINATYTKDLSTEEILEKVSKHQIDCTIVDSNVYALNLRYYPEIAMAFSISGREQLAWILPAGATYLKEDMYTWLNFYNQQGKIAQLKDHYYSYVLFFDYYNIKVFYKRIKSRLSKYKKIFQEAATKFGIPWTLIAAISYQESHWNAKAKSFTGVRGLMMLTRHTAKLLGVKNRLNPKESIVGGTRHIKQMLKLVDDKVKGENRLKFALAAYDIGMGHIRDAQILAKETGLNENIWSDLKVVLPLLSQKKYYRGLKYGYSRGNEAVKYVESIYNYRDILENQLLSQSKLTTPHQ